MFIYPELLHQFSLYSLREEMGRYSPLRLLKLYQLHLGLGQVVEIASDMLRDLFWPFKEYYLIFIRLGLTRGVLCLMKLKSPPFRLYA